MRWFKHDSNANMDKKIQEVLIDYGLEGYGLYFYCLELICGNITESNLNFELEHDARIIARNTGSSSQKVSEMMARFIELGLFENHDGRITCLKMLTRLDTSMTGNSRMRREITSKKEDHDLVMTKSCERRVKKIEKKIEKKEEGNRDNVAVILEYLNYKTNSKFKKVDSNLKLISARLNEDNTVDTLKGVIDTKVIEWADDPKMSKYLRPSTLFKAEKFNQYVGQLEDSVRNSGGF